MESDDKIRRLDKSVPREFALILRMAKEKGLWIYQKSEKKWFTPDEFREVAHRLIKREPGGHSNQWDFHTADPWEGLRLRIEYLERVTQQIRDFSNRLEAFYKKPEFNR